jgi:hypothetical protein
MSVVAGMRSALVHFARQPNPCTPYYASIDGGTVAYNGSHYTLILDSSTEPPRYPGNVPTLLCESRTTRVWRLDYCLVAHIARSRRKAPVTTGTL